MSITMPYALQQMQAMYQRTPDQTHARFVHYTTAEAALSIIRTKRFWLRNTNCMSDYREVQHGFDIFNRYFLDAARARRLLTRSTLLHQESPTMPSPPLTTGGRTSD